MIIALRYKAVLFVGLMTLVMPQFGHGNTDGALEYDDSRMRLSQSMYPPYIDGQDDNVYIEQDEDSEDDENDESDNDNEESEDELTFHGYPCTVDCSGHEAGYEWAEKHNITDPDDCGGKSQSFIEGCRAYAEEQ